jgi:hypothetical protein
MQEWLGQGGCWVDHFAPLFVTRVSAQHNATLRERWLS